MKILLTKTTDGFLVPADEAAKRVADRYAPGELILAEVVKNRSAQNHRRFFLFVGVTFDMQDSYTDREIWRKVLEIGAGHFDTVIGLDGKAHYWPKSIAWEKLDENEFGELFGRVVNAFLFKYGAGVTREELEQAIQF